MKLIKKLYWLVVGKPYKFIEIRQIGFNPCVTIIETRIAVAQ